MPYGDELQSEGTDPTGRLGPWRGEIISRGSHLMTARRLEQESVYGKEGGRETEEGSNTAYIALAGLDAR
jgi:hypothetical protein